MIPPNDGRAITMSELEMIERNFLDGFYDQPQLKRLFQTIRVQKVVLGALFARYHHEPFKRSSVADPILNSELTHLKEMVSLDGSL